MESIMIIARVAKIEFTVKEDEQTHKYAKNGIRLNDTKQECNEPIGLLGTGNCKSVIAQDLFECPQLVAPTVHHIALSYCGQNYNPEDFTFKFKYTEIDPETKEFWSTPGSWSDSYNLSDFPTSK
jgi:hypothetical protein